MSVSLPAIEQQSPKIPAKNGRNGSAGNAQGFGKLVKSNDGGHKGQGLAAQRSEAGKDARTAKLSIDLDGVTDGISSLERVVEALSGADETEAPHIGDGQDDPDSSDGAEALLPLLTIAEFRHPKDVQIRHRESSSGNVGALDARNLPPPTIEDNDAIDRQQGRLAAVLEQADPDAPARPAETAFGRTLIANLSALATQAPDRTVPDEGARTTRIGGTDSPEALIAADKGATRRDRNTILPEAVTRAGEPRETGDRRAEARTASVDPKAVAVPSLQLPLSTGASIVQALAASPASTAGATAAEIASQSGTGPAQTLKIQLHPAELGMVTAKLRMADGQLSIEIEVETSDAYNRLSGENDAIARALRSHGISVDQVVIQAPQTQSGSPARDSAGNFADTSSGAERNFSESGDFGQPNGSGYANRNPGHDNGHEVETASSAQQRTDSGSTGHGVYI